MASSVTCRPQLRLARKEHNYRLPASYGTDDLSEPYLQHTPATPPAPARSSSGHDRYLDQMSYHAAPSAKNRNARSALAPEPSSPLFVLAPDLRVFFGFGFNGKKSAQSPLPNSRHPNLLRTTTPRRLPRQTTRLQPTHNRITGTSEPTPPLVLSTRHQLTSLQRSPNPSDSTILRGTPLGDKLSD